MFYFICRKITRKNRKIKSEIKRCTETNSKLDRFKKICILCKNRLHGIVEKQVVDAERLVETNSRLVEVKASPRMNIFAMERLDGPTFLKIFVRQRMKAWYKTC